MSHSLLRGAFFLGVSRLKIDKKPKHLTRAFYKAYAGCGEILQKEHRQYCMALLEVDGILFAIPFRTHIRHKHSYIFKDSSRSDQSGLDFTKAVVVTDPSYIGEETLIDSGEYAEFLKKQDVIARRFDKFIRDYKKWAVDPAKYHAERIIAFSALQYFHAELGL